jgi:hypothetical protein
VGTQPALARETGARFTYFLSCTYLLTWETRANTAAGPWRGRSNVGFGFSREDVAARLDHIWRPTRKATRSPIMPAAISTAASWSAGEWLHEFAEFDRIVAGAYEINGIEGEPEGWRDWRNANGGFRAPYLSVGDGLFAALSRAWLSPMTPRRSRGAGARPAGERHRDLRPADDPGRPRRPTRHRHGLQSLRAPFGRVRARGRDGQFEERAYRAFLDAFEANMRRANPLQIGFHFTLMNGGAYWNALERFVREVCVDGRCRLRQLSRGDGTTGSATGTN